MLRSEVKSRILQGINDDVSTPVFLTDAQLNDLVNDSAELIAADTRSVKRSAFVPLRAGSKFYYLPSIAPDILFPYRVWTNQNTRRLTALSMSELDEFQTKWLNTDGDPEIWFPVSWDMIGIYPSPASGDNVMRVDYYAWPRALMDNEDESELMEATQDALVLMGIYLGLLKKWDGENATATLQTLLAHKSLAQGRSGILKIASRNFQRSRALGRGGFPSTLRSEGTS